MIDRRSVLIGAGSVPLLLAGAGASGHGAALAMPVALPHMVAIASDLFVARLSSRSWVVSATHPLGGMLVPANGLICLTGAGPVLVDPGWTVAQAETLVRFATARFGRPAGAIGTHFHEDRVGGLAAVRAAGIPSYVNPLTAAMLEGGPRPRLAHHPVQVFGLETFWPGAAHTPDNMVVWSPHDRVLLGGCMVKDAQATALGNIADADLAAWPVSLARVRARYRGARIVVPGHGALGGDPIARTDRLLAMAS